MSIIKKLNEKAKSVAQQHLMGAVHHYQKTGELPKNKSFATEVKAVANGKGEAKGISKKAAKEFASTKHEGLPQKKESHRPTFKEFLAENEHIEVTLDDVLNSEAGAALSAAWNDGDERAVYHILMRELDDEQLVDMVLDHMGF